MPTLLLLDRLFAHIASESGATTSPPFSSDNDAGFTKATSVRETDICLQDYNRSVLELVTFPNILLTWCPSVLPAHSIPSPTSLTDEQIDMSPLSAEYRSSATGSDSDENDNGNDNDNDNEWERSRTTHRRRPGGLTVTPALLAAFTASLGAHKVRLRFFAGGWSSLSELLTHRGLGRPPAPAPPPYDIVLASETIYRPEALGAFLSVLRTAVAVAPSCDDQEVPPPPPLCLVAAKVVYFGVGGGVQGFVRAVEEENGTVRTVWEHREGVGRMIIRVEW